MRVFEGAQKKCHRIEVSNVITSRMIRLGSDYGGWQMDPHGISSESIVYSFGVGTDVSFDLALIEIFQCVVHAFDPTPCSIEWVHTQKLPTEFCFHQFGIADHDGLMQFYPPEDRNHISHTLLYRPNTADRSIQVEVRRLSGIMDMLGHEYIDLIKLDIEGAEFAVIDSIITDKITVNQLLVEFHDRFIKNGIESKKCILQKLHQNGFRLCAVSSSGLEYSFINSHLSGTS